MFALVFLSAAAAFLFMVTGSADAAGVMLAHDFSSDSDAASQVYDSIVNGKGWAGAGTIVAAFVYFLKKYDVKIPKVGAAIDRFLDQPIVSFALPLVVALVGGFGTAIAAAQAHGVPVKDALLPALFGALKVTGSAAFQFLLVKNAAEQKAHAAEAGQAAATAASASKASAIEELKKP